MEAKIVNIQEWRIRKRNEILTHKVLLRGTGKEISKHNQELLDSINITSPVEFGAMTPERENLLKQIITSTKSF